jgi:hypothetical protein
MLCRLVAHHSCALIEAGDRGLADVLALEFELAPDALASALTYCDMTTSHDGESVPVERRLAEICDRYGPGHPVTESNHRPSPYHACRFRLTASRWVWLPQIRAALASEDVSPGLALSGAVVT